MPKNIKAIRPKKSAQTILIKPKMTLGEVQKMGKTILAVPENLPDPTLSENSAYIAKTRYAFRDSEGNPAEGPREMFWRVAYNVATAERLFGDKKTHQEWAENFYTMMAAQKFIPNTPTMVNAGKENQQLSACFVLPVEDSMEGILKTMTNMAMIHKTGGGTGFSFSRLRPKDDVIGSSGGKTTGPVAFMQAYNDVTSQIRQGGVRRGANMGILHITHPDILRFAIHKVDEFSLTNFNISVTVTEDFMEQVKRDEQFVGEEADISGIIAEVKEGHATRDLDLKLVMLDKAVNKLYDICRATQEGEGYDLINPRSGHVAGKLNAKRVFDVITRLAWQYGDPGMIIMDRINNSRANPTPRLGQIEATNPCGEQPLLPYDACTLGSINLGKFVKNGRMDWEGLEETVSWGVRFLDDVLDMNEYPIEEISKMTRAIRRIGLGVMGFADALVQLGIGYNTEEGYEMGQKLMKFVQKTADDASQNLAKIKGVFPAFVGSIYDKPGEIKPRNAARTTIAPTGTISMLAGCSSGIEPYFALAYAKNTIEGKRLFETNQYFLEVAKERGFYSDELFEAIGENKGSVRGLDEVPEDIQKVFVVASDIVPEEHVKMQASFQKFTDNAISKTINFPNEATVEDVRDAYWLSYETGCRGITIYRDGSREKQIYEVKKDKSYYDQLSGKGYKEDEEGNVVPVIRKKPVPIEALGMRLQKVSDLGKVYTSVFYNGNNEAVEVFVNIGKHGGYVSGAAEVTGRLASRALKYGAPLEEVASDLIGISCGTPYGLGPNAILSAFDAVGKSLLEISSAKQLTLLDEDKEEKIEPVHKTNGVTNGHSPALQLNAFEPSKTAGQITISAKGKEGPGAVFVSPIRTVIPDKTFGACPECGSPVAFEEGCQKCLNPSCGYSKCS